VVDSSGIEVARNAVVWEIFADDPDGVAARLRGLYGSILEPEFCDSPPFKQRRVRCNYYEMSHYGFRIRVAYTRQASFREVSIATVERRDTVTVELVAQEWQGTSTLERRLDWAEVQLNAHLNRRAVVDASTGLPIPPWPQRG
jgi:hypothetical protein